VLYIANSDDNNSNNPMHNSFIKQIVVSG